MHRGVETPRQRVTDAVAQLDVGIRSRTSIQPRTKRPQQQLHWRKAAEWSNIICTRFCAALCHTTTSRSAGQESICFSDAEESIFGAPITAEVTATSDGTRPGITELSGVAPGHYDLELGNPPRSTELDASASGQVDPTREVQRSRDGTAMSAGECRLKKLPSFFNPGMVRRATQS